MQLAWRPRQQKQIRPLLRDVRRQIEAGRAAMFVRQNHRAFRDVGLARYAVRELESTTGRPFLDRPQNRRIMFQFQAEQIRRGLARDVVRRRAETTSDEDDVRAFQRFGDRMTYRLAIRNGDLTLDP